ncbi:MAG: tyrosine-type recombinase/integrase [Candidatus Sulfobium sp.]
MTLPANITRLEEAEAIERELKHAAKPNEIQVPKNRTVGDLFREYLDWYDLHRSPTTYRDCEGVFKNHINPHLGQYIANEISINHINVYKRLRHGEGGKNRTITTELHYFSGFRRWAAKLGFIEKKDFNIERLPYTRPIPIVLSLKEAIKLINAAEPFYRGIFILLFTCGCRLKEARQLKWTEVDFQNRTIKILGKGGKENILPMADLLYTELKKLKKKASSEWVFQSRVRDDIPVQDIRKAIARAKKKAKITKRVYPHLLRHSLATHLLDSDVNLRRIQEILGHADVSTTEFYTQVAVKMKRDAMKKAGIGKLSTQKPRGRRKLSTRTRQKTNK